MKEKKTVYVGTLADLVKFIDQDLSDEFDIDSVAFELMEILEGRVSSSLWDLLFNLLLGFDGKMQVEIADDLLDFVCNHTVHTTGCISADTVLKSCYRWIAEEQGFDKDVINKLIV